MILTALPLVLVRGSYFVRCSFCWGDFLGLTFKVRHGAQRSYLHCLVCAQHGRDVNGVQVPCRKTRHENEETTI
jgi:hypothetical protein